MSSDSEHSAAKAAARGAASPASAIGYRALLATHASARHLWLGQTISFIGDWFNLIALLTAVQALSSSAQAVTLVMVAKTLPVFVVTPLAGPIVDRFDRRRLLIATDLLRAACALVVVASHLAGSLTGLYAGTVLMMMSTGVAVPTKSAVLPMIVAPPLVPMANALFGGTWSVMLAVGAAAGGVATQALGVTASLLIDGATFLVSAWFFVRLPALPPPPRAASDQGARFVDGLRYLVRQPYILAVTALKPMAQIYGGITALLPLFGTVVFAEAAGPLYIGGLYAARGAGAMIGSLAVRAVFGDSVRTMRRAILIGYLLSGSCFAALSLCDRYWQALIAYFGAAVGQAAIWVFSGTLLQLEADRRFHGRVFAIEFGLMMLVLSISSWIAGYLLDGGVALTHLVAGLAALATLPLALWTFTLIAVRRRSAASEGEPARSMG